MISDYLFSNIPDQLLDQMAWLSGLISKHRAADPKSEALKPYTDHLLVLQRVYAYIHDTRAIYHQNTLLKDQNQWLSLRFHEQQAKLTEYDTLMKLKSEDRLDEVNEVCSIIVENAQHWLDIRRKTQQQAHSAELVHQHKLSDEKPKIQSSKQYP